MTDEKNNFKLFPEESREITFGQESKKVFKQTQEDLVFKKGKAVQSRVMSSPLFNSTIENYGIDAAKTVILQELMKMSEDEVLDEIQVLSGIAEDNTDIKRSLRAAKFLAVQWLDDEKRTDEMRQKCQFIIESIPTFKGSSRSAAEKTKREIKPAEHETPAGELIFPDIEGKPLPPANPASIKIRRSEVVHKLYPGEKILIITDVQGDYGRLRETLLRYEVIEYKNGLAFWNPHARTKLAVSGDLFNKTPYSSWGGRIVHKTFQVTELFRKLVSQAEDEIHLSLGSYDLKIATEQLFRDASYGLTGDYGGLAAQAQSIPALISYLEGTAFDSAGSIYSLWEKTIIDDKLFFRLRPEFQVSGQPDILIDSNEMNLPDISSLRDLLMSLYNELTLPPASRPKSLKELDQKALSYLRPKPGENIEAMADSKQRAFLLEGVLKGSGTIEFLKTMLVSRINFETDRKQLLKISHVSLQENTARMFEKLKGNNWQLPSDEDFLRDSKLLKIKKTDPGKFLDDLHKAGFATLNEFLTTEAEDIYEMLNSNNLLELFIPVISPNKIKFGYVKGIERFQKGLAGDDKSGLAGFEVVDRKNENELDDSEMKKISELNENARRAYTDKVLSDIFGSSSGFIVQAEANSTVLCKKDRWKVTIEIDKHAALYEDKDKAIHVPIKHIVLVEYL